MPNKTTDKKLPRKELLDWVSRTRPMRMKKQEEERKLSPYPINYDANKYKRKY